MDSIAWSVDTPKRFIVYALTRPDGRVFYVGKGVPKRPRDHALEARNAECICRKCEIIRGLWACGKDVTVVCLFETDSDGEARKAETRYIREMGQRYRLCNKHQAPTLRPPVPDVEMSYVDYIAWLDWIDATGAERRGMIEDWAQRRYGLLHREWRSARRQRYDEEAEALTSELEQLATLTGKAMQNTLPWDGEKPPKKWYEYRK